jgi:NADH:ubiquinone oxidoreductase subunit E
MDLSRVDDILAGRGSEPFDVMEALQDVQAAYHYLPEEALRRVSEVLAVPLIEVFRLANFYKAFSLKARGRHLITVCMGTACHVRESPRFLDEVTRQLGVAAGGTTADGEFTVETVNCLGACALAPVVVMDGKYYEHMTPARLRGLLGAVRVQDGKRLVHA